MNLSFVDLAKMAPAIVPVDLDGYGHFVVVRGVTADHVLLADPAFGNRTLPIENFQRAWVRQMAFVVKRRDGSTAPNVLAAQPHDLVRSSPEIVRAAIR